MLQLQVTFMSYVRKYSSLRAIKIINIDTNVHFFRDRTTMENYTTSRLLFIDIGEVPLLFITFSPTGAILLQYLAILCYKHRINQDKIKKVQEAVTSIEQFFDSDSLQNKILKVLLFFFLIRQDFEC